MSLHLGGFLSPFLSAKLPLIRVLLRCYSKSPSSLSLHHCSKSLILQDLVLQAGVVFRDKVLRVKLLTVLFVHFAHLLETHAHTAEDAQVK